LKGKKFYETCIFPYSGTRKKSLVPKRLLIKSLLLVLAFMVVFLAGLASPRPEKRSSSSSILGGDLLKI
jgi:hypothetical protein